MPDKTDEEKLAAWRAAKLKEWNDPDSKIRQKHPTRDGFDRWLSKQCNKAITNKHTGQPNTNTTSPTQPVVAIDNVHFTHTRYGTTKVLHGCSMQLYQGEVLGMFGLNEAGKTTIGKLITGDLKPDSGTVNVRGRLLIGHPVQLYCACAVLVSTLFMAMIELREGMQREGWLSEWLTSRGVIASVLVLLVVLILAYRHSKARRAAAITMKAILVTSEVCETSSQAC